MTNSEVDRMIAEYEKIAIPDEEMDCSELPPFTGEQQLVQFKPAHPENFNREKRQITISVYSSLANYLEAIGDNWESKVNDYAAG